MKKELVDRSQTLFGRGPDLAQLESRAQYKGITAIVGRAQMGKTWLLTEFARRLSKDSAPLNYRTIENQVQQAPRSYLVGFTESLGETADLLLRAVVDLYTRWLTNASYGDQWQIVWAQQKKDFVTRTGKTFGSIVEKLSKLGTKPIEAVGGLVKETFDGLAIANRELLTGGVQLPHLQTEQGRELLSLVSHITGLPLVLVFDQWEKSPGIEVEANILDNFLRQIEEWPQCHIFLGLRPEGKPLAAVRELCQAFPGLAEIYELPPMHLDGRAADELLQYLRKTVPATRETEPANLLAMVDGYPGTLARWTSPYYALRIRSAEELNRIAKDAIAYRFAEFEELMPMLSEPERRVGMRLALLPTSAEAEQWSLLRAVVLDKAHGRDLDSLRRKNILESSPPPSYGHAKRREAALLWFKVNCGEELGELGDSLILSLASRVHDLGQGEIPFVESLANLHPLSQELKLSVVSRALCDSGLSLLGLPNVAPEMLLSAIDTICRDPSNAPVALLVSVALYNAIKRRVAPTQHVLLLEALRRLASVFPEEAGVREWLAKGLFYTLNHANEEGMESQPPSELIQELAKLNHLYPDDKAVCEWLAKGMFVCLRNASSRRNLNLRDLFLEALRLCCRENPDVAAVRDSLAMGLVKTMEDANKEGSPSRRGMLLDEIRLLAHSHPDDGAVRDSYADALLNESNYAKFENVLERRDSMLDELRQLALRYSDDEGVSQAFATALHNTVNDAKDEQALQRRDALLEELRQLARAHPLYRGVREWFAKSLFNTTIDAKQEGALKRRDALLDELRELGRDYPEDKSVREWLAKGLSNDLLDAKEEGALERRELLLEELRELNGAHPEDDIVRQRLEKAIAIILADCQVPEQRLKFEEQLRQLSLQAVAARVQRLFSQ